MKVEVVKLNRKYNLGNYETIDVGFEAVLTELEGANAQATLDAVKNLEKLADTYYTMVRFQADMKPISAKQEGNVVRAAPAGPEPPTPEPKKTVLTLENIDWVDGGETDKGPYQKSASKPIDFYNIRKRH